MYIWITVHINEDRYTTGNSTNIQPINTTEIYQIRNAHDNPILVTIVLIVTFGCIGTVLLTLLIKFLGQLIYINKTPTLKDKGISVKSNDTNTPKGSKNELPSTTTTIIEEKYEEQTDIPTDQDKLLSNLGGIKINSQSNIKIDSQNEHKMSTQNIKNDD